MFGTGVADYALEPRYAELLWEVSAEYDCGRKVLTGIRLTVLGAPCLRLAPPLTTRSV